MADQTYGKATPERGLAFALEGALQGFVQGRGMDRQNVQDQRDAETQAVEMKAAQLDQQIKQAQFDEYMAGQKIREATAKADLAAKQAKDPIELKRLQIDKAKWESAEAQARAHKAELEYQQAQQLRSLTDTLNRIQGFLPPQATDESSAYPGGPDAPEGVDTRDMPAVDMASVSRGTIPQSIATKGIVQGGRPDVGAPTRAGAMRLEGLAPPMAPSPLRSILPPAMAIQREPRAIPIQQSEVEQALKAKDANKAIADLMTTEGVPFGSALIKMKQENPLEYAKQVNQLLDNHVSENKALYQTFNEGGVGGASKLRQMVFQTLMDPGTRAIQNPVIDIEAAVSNAVADLSLEAVMKPSANNKIYSWIALDAAQNGDVPRYSGRLLNHAMNETFGAQASRTRFAEDQDYTLRQIVHALYSDEDAANGQALLGYTDPFTEAKFSMKRSQQHPLMALLDTYWEPLRTIEANQQIQRMGRLNTPRGYHGD